MKSARSSLRGALVLSALLVSGAAFAVTPPSVWAPGEAALQARLVAPCCWNQTLDMHESPLADALRLEVHERLLAGEARERIEDDLAARYGERVRAVPKGADRRGFVAVALVCLVALGGLAALLVLRRLRRRGDQPSTIGAAEPEATVTARDAYDERLDAELAAISEDGP